MFITKQTAGAIINEEPEEELLQDYERVILGDIIQVENKDELSEDFIGEVIYNDSHQLVATSTKNDTELKLTFDIESSELIDMVLNEKNLSPEGTIISVIKKAKQLGFIKLHNFQLNDRIRVVAGKNSNFDSFEGTIVNIKNDSLVLLVDNENENTEIHFNYKGIPPESGIQKIEKIETDIPVGEIIFQSDEEMIISDFVDIDEKNKLYTISDKKDDYINKSLSSLLPNVNKKKEYQNIIAEIDTWLKLEDKDKIDYSKALYKDYFENNFSNEYLLPISSDKKKIYMTKKGYDMYPEPEDDEKYYQILGSKNAIMRDLTLSKEITDSLIDKEKKKDFPYIIEKKNELWSSISSYLPVSDCETSNARHDTLTIRDNKTSKVFAYYDTEIQDVVGIDFDTRILLSNNDMNIEGQIGESFCLTGHMRLPYSFRTKVNMGKGIYTVKDIVKNPRYKSI